jgi:hypothetical protein
VLGIDAEATKESRKLLNLCGPLFLHHVLEITRSFSVLRLSPRPPFSVKMAKFYMSAKGLAFCFLGGRAVDSQAFSKRQARSLVLLFAVVGTRAP